LQDEQDMPPPDRRDKAVAVFSTELLAAEREYQAFLDDINSRSATGQTARIPSLAEVQSRLHRDEALLEYVVGDNSIVIFVVRSGTLSALTSDLDQPNLKAKVALVRELVQQPSNDRWWEPAASLSESLIRPLEQRGLLDDVRHLYLVPHDILNYLPFALLPIGPGEGGDLVMERFSLTYLPTAVTLVRDDPAGQQPASLLALAPANSRLRFALEEARSITEVYRPNSTLLSGHEATESKFKAQANGYTILHFSTHGYFNAKNPLLSGLELEPDTLNDGFLEVHEILNLSLNAELVTLSACETGMSSGYFNQLPAGDEFVGLTRAFLLAGSRSVLATLWEVDDRSTVEIMEGFYHYLDRSGRTGDQADSLVQVQRELRKSKQYRHPFYWAPFVLVGQQDRHAASQGQKTRMIL
jgi:CHAT domain-containing protein